MCPIISVFSIQARSGLQSRAEIRSHLLLETKLRARHFSISITKDAPVIP